MSENHDRDQELLPDDAEQKMNELLEALGEKLESEELAEEGETVDDLGGDFVDLDAELLGNSADMLELDEDDPSEAQPIGEVQASSQDDDESPVVEAPGIPRVHQRFDSESMAARFRELEQELMRRQAKSLRVPPPPASAMPAWVMPLLILIALLMSGGALWLTLDSPQSQSPTPIAVTAGSASGMKEEFAALRERLAAVEKQAAEGKEAVTILERMQGTLARMEQKLLSGGVAVEPETSTVVVADEVPVVEDKPNGKARHENTVAGGGLSGEAAVQSSTQKVFVKGWAVNLRSYYHRSDAERLLQRYQDSGINAEIREIPKGSATWYRVRVMGFASKQKAEAFIEGLTVEQGREEAWPSYYEGYVEG